MTFDVVHRLSEEQIQQLHYLYQAEWWTQGRTLNAVRMMLANTHLLFGFCDPTTHQLIAFARVLTDRVYKAFIFDVIVDTSYRNRGLGLSLMETICTHPDVQTVRDVELYCKPDMMLFYRKLGFSEDLTTRRLMRQDKTT